MKQILINLIVGIFLHLLFPSANSCPCAIHEPPAYPSHPVLSVTTKSQ